MGKEHRLLLFGCLLMLLNIFWVLHRWLPLKELEGKSYVVSVVIKRKAVC